MKQVLLIIAALFTLAIVLAAVLTPKPGYLVQQGLYPVKLPLLQGTLPEKGQPTVIEFWRIDCPGCLESIRHLNEVHARYRPRGLRVLGITDDAPEALRRFQLRNPIQYDLASDPGGRLQKALSVYALPDAVLLDHRGIIRWRGDPRTLTDREIEDVLR